MKPVHYDICIIGAGPAGCAAALGLRDKGLKVVMVDKALFPREKVCGDAIPGPAIKALSLALPFFSDSFESLKDKQRITGSIIRPGSGPSIEYRWKLPAYNIRREVFDDFMLGLVREHTSTWIRQGEKVKGIRTGSPHEIVCGPGDSPFTASLIIGCDGAGSATRKSLHQQGHRQELVMAARAYFRGLRAEQTTNLFYVSRKSLPGYFWIFPLGKGEFNVGLGMLAGKDGKVGTDIREQLNHFIRQEAMKDIFEEAEQLSVAKAAILPLGGMRRAYSGHACLLAGDAATLADPLMGNGIDKAVISGLLAAKQAAASFHSGDLGQKAMSNYDRSIRLALGKEIMRNRRQRILLSRFPALLGLYARFRK